MAIGTGGTARARGPRPARRAAAAADGIWRIAYRLGFRVARLWYRLRRPDHDGAVVAVWCDGRILAVQQSYRSNLSWPGGGIHRDEDPREAARRELEEELGLVVAAEDLVACGEVTADWDHRRDRVRIFELHLPREPAIRVDNREIVAAAFMRPEALAAERVLPPFIRAYLARPVADRGGCDLAAGAISRPPPSGAEAERRPGEARAAPRPAP